jgi:glycosyltransferase involved in cell wall biosynthesis
MPDSRPSVSVIIPTYNRARTIGRALRSVLQQTYGNLEVIVVDDGSTDRTKNVVEGFNDTRVSYVRLPSKHGANAARNAGIKLATSDFIAFQDSDDEWLPYKIEKQMEVFQAASTDTGVVYTGFIRYCENEAIYLPKRNGLKSGRILTSLLEGNFITTQSVVIRRRCFDEVGMFDENIPRFQDWELFLRIAEEYDFICIDEPHVVAYHSPISITANDELQPIAFEAILRKHRQIFCRYQKLASIYYLLGISSYNVGKMGAGTKWLLSALRKKPARASIWLRIIFALPGKRFYRFSSRLMEIAGRVTGEIIRK